MKIITDIEWQDFVNGNIVCDDIIEIISIRIKNNDDLTDRELAIYDSNARKIEDKILSL